MNRRTLFITSCISIGTAAAVFAVRGDIAGAMGNSFQLTNEQIGMVFSPAFYGFAVAILLSGLLVDVMGMRSLHVLSGAAFIAGVVSEAVAPLFGHAGTTMLYVGFFLFGMGMASSRA